LTQRDFLALFLTRKVKKGECFAVYGGWLYALGDPRIPKDSTYQTSLVIAGQTFILDAKGVDASVSKGQFANDGLTNNAKCRIRGAPNGAKYSLLYALNDYPIHEEMDTQYDREYWLRKPQWAKLSEQDKVKAAEVYNICTPDMLID
jgi:hypothetical protein